MSANSVKTFSGYDTDSRTSSKVLRPPGGGNTDIFGINDTPVQASAPTAAPAETSAPPDSAPTAVEVSEPAAKVEPAPVEPAEASSSPPSDKPQNVAAGGGNQERVRIDPMSGRIMSAPAARSGRVPPGGYSSGPLW